MAAPTRRKHQSQTNTSVDYPRAEWFWSIIMAPFRLNFIFGAWADELTMKQCEIARPEAQNNLRKNCSAIFPGRNFKIRWTQSDDRRSTKKAPFCAAQHRLKRNSCCVGAILISLLTESCLIFRLSPAWIMVGGDKQGCLSQNGIH